MHLAVDAQQLPLVKAMLGKPIDLTIADASGKTALEKAQQLVQESGAPARTMSLEDPNNPLESIAHLLTKACVTHEATAGQPKSQQAFSAAAVSPGIAKKINQLVEVAEETPVEAFTIEAPPVVMDPPTVIYSLHNLDVEIVDDYPDDQDAETELSDLDDADMYALTGTTSQPLSTQSPAQSPDRRISTEYEQLEPSMSRIEEEIDFFKPIEAPPKAPEHVPAAPIAPTPVLSAPTTTYSATNTDELESLRKELLKERTANQALRQAIAETETKRKGQRTLIDEMQLQLDQSQTITEERDAKIVLLENELLESQKQRLAAQNDQQRHLKDLNEIKLKLRHRDEEVARLKTDVGRLETNLNDSIDQLKRAAKQPAFPPPLQDTLKKAVDKTPSAKPQSMRTFQIKCLSLM
jgi:hypothetical protein